jgi:hypothetical protein
MAMQESKITAIFTVMLNNGKEIQHKYNIPSDRDRGIEFVEDLGKMVAAAMGRK